MHHSVIDYEHSIKHKITAFSHIIKRTYPPLRVFIVNNLPVKGVEVPCLHNGNDAARWKPVSLLGPHGTLDRALASRSGKK
jgi:hypothetical protein